MLTLRTKSKSLFGAACAAAAALCLAGGASAATHPGGGSAFSGGPEGWQVVGAPSCNIGLLGLLGVCKASGGWDGGAGNPPGSLRSQADITVNVGGLLSANTSFVSPNFVASEGGPAALRLDRALNSNLLDLNPSATYTVNLIDRGSGAVTQILTETVAGNAPFASRSAAASLVAGRTYALGIDTTLSSSLAGVGLLGSSALRLDNVELTAGSGGGPGGGGDDGAGTGGRGGDGGKGGSGGSGGPGAVSSAELRSIMLKESATTPVALKGNRLFAKVSCPARIGRACRISAQGMLNRRKPATFKRAVKVGKGRTKQVVLRVKPKLRAKVAKRKRLLVRERVRAGSAKATVLKSRKLIRR